MKNADCEDELQAMLDRLAEVTRHYTRALVTDASENEVDEYKNSMIFLVREINRFREEHGERNEKLRMRNEE